MRFIRVHCRAMARVSLVWTLMLDAVSFLWNELDQKEEKAVGF